MMFTDENTTGYTVEEIAALNAELAERLDGIEDIEAIAEITQAFNDEVSRR